MHVKASSPRPAGRRPVDSGPPAASAVRCSRADRLRMLSVLLRLLHADLHCLLVLSRQRLLLSAPVARWSRWRLRCAHRVVAATASLWVCARGSQFCAARCQSQLSMAAVAPAGLRLPRCWRLALAWHQGKQSAEGGRGDGDGSVGGVGGWASGRVTRPAAGAVSSAPATSTHSSASCRQTAHACSGKKKKATSRWAADAAEQSGARVHSGPPPHCHQSARSPRPRLPIPLVHMQRRHWGCLLDRQIRLTA